MIAWLSISLLSETESNYRPRGFLYEYNARGMSKPGEIKKGNKISLALSSQKNGQIRDEDFVNLMNVDAVYLISPCGQFSYLFIRVPYRRVSP